MKPLNVWALGGLLALATAARMGVAFTEGEILRGSSLTAASVTADTADIQVLINGLETIQRTGPGEVSARYTVMVKNAGPAAATNVHVVIPIPNDIRGGGVDSTLCTFGQTVDCTLGNLASGQTVPLEITIVLPGFNGTCQDLTTQIRAFAWSDSLDKDNGNNQANRTTVVLCPAAPATADVSMYLTGAESVTRGGTFGYALYVKNSGGIAAQGVVTIMPVPANMTYIDAQSDTRCDVVGINVMCQIGSLNPGQNADPISIVFQTSPQIPCVPVAQNATVGTTTPDSNTANNQSTYSLQVNCSSSQASSAVSASAQNSSISMYNDWSSSRSTASSMSSSSRVIGTTGADIELTAVSPATVERGFTFTHVFTMTNYGPQAASYPALYDPMGNGFSFEPTGSDTRCKMEGGNIKCSGPVSMAAGASETFVVVIRSAGTQTCNATSIINPSVYHYTADPFPANGRVSLPIKITCGNPTPPPPPPPPPFSSRASSASSRSVYSDPPSSASSRSTASVGSADLVLANRALAYTVNRGSPITFNADTWNNGPAAAPNVRVTMGLPANTTFNAALSDSRCKLDGYAITCAAGTMELKALAQFKIVIDTTAQTVCGSLAFTTQIQSDAIDPVSTNNQNSSYITITCPAVPTANLDLRQGNTDLRVNQGGVIIQKMQVTNMGPNEAVNTIISSPIVPGFTYNDAQSDARCDQVGNNVLCALGTLSVTPNDPVIKQPIPMDVNIAFTASPTQTCATTYSSIAKITSDTLDPNTFSNSAEVRAYVRCASRVNMYVTMPVVLDTDSAAKNQKNITLMRFSVQHDSDDYIVFEGVRFAATAGSVLNATNYTLWVDMDYNGTTETQLKTGVSAANGVVSFTNLPGGGQTINAKKGMAMEVHADVASTVVSTQLQLGFDTNGVNDYVMAAAADGYIGKVATNGGCPGGACHIFVTTAPTKSWYIANQGNLYITKDAELVRSHQYLAGVLGDTALRLNFRSPNEEIDVYQLQISTWDSTASGVERLELYKLGEVTPFAMATVAACGNEPVLTVNPTNAKSIRTFCANMQAKELVIPTYQEIDVLVKPLLKTDTDGALSGESMTFWLPNRSGTVKARGVGSTNTLTPNDGDTIGEGEVFVGTNTATVGTNVVGNPNQSVLSKIILIFNAASNPGRVMVGPGQEIGRFRVGTTNNTNVKNGLNKPVVTDVIFAVASANMTMDTATFTISSSADFLAKKPCSVVPGGAAGEVLVECRNLSYEANPTLDISLQVDLTSIGLSNAWIQSSLKNFADINNLQFGPNPGQSRLKWLDSDAFTKDFLWVEAIEPIVYSTKFLR